MHDAYRAYPPVTNAVCNVPMETVVTCSCINSLNVIGRNRSTWRTTGRHFSVSSLLSLHSATVTVTCVVLSTITSLSLGSVESLFLSTSTEELLFSSNSCLANFREDDNIEEDIELVSSLDDGGFNNLPESSESGCSGTLRITVLLLWDK